EIGSFTITAIASTFISYPFNVEVLGPPDISITSNLEVGCQSMVLGIDSLDPELRLPEVGMQPDGPCPRVCEFSTVRYFASSSTATSGFTWTVTGGNMIPGSTD